jgi:hypothetical protein
MNDHNTLRKRGEKKCVFRTKFQVWTNKYKHQCHVEINMNEESLCVKVGLYGDGGGGGGWTNPKLLVTQP